MTTLKGKFVATAVVLAMNAMVLLLLGWFVVLTAVPSLLFLAAVLRR